MAKKKKKAKELTKKEIRLGKKAQRQRRMILVGTTIVAAVVVVLLVFGFYQEYIVKPREPVAVVGEVPIRTDTYEKMVRYYRSNLDNQLAMLQDQLARLDPDDESTEFITQYYEQNMEQLQTQRADATLGPQVLDDLIDDELIRREAVRRGIGVTPEEVQLEIETQFGYERNPPTPTPTPITTTLTITPTPTVTPVTLDRFQEMYANTLEALKEQAGFSEADFRYIFEAMLLREKLQEAMSQEVPTIADQVHARQIQVTNEEQAQAIMTLLEEDTDEASALDVFRLLLAEEGEEFKTEDEIRAEKDSQELLTQLLESEDRFVWLAQNFSLDTGSKDDGGDLGWFSRGMMVPEFEEAAFSTPAGVITGPVETQFGWHIIFVQEVSESEAEAETEAEAEETESQVWASHILVDTEEEALAIMTLLDEDTDEDTALSALDVFIEAEVAKARAKEEEVQELLAQWREDDDPFALLAENFSEDWASKDKGGDMDWFPRGEETPEFEEIAFSLAVGEISEPISNTIGYHIIEVLGHEERELAPQILERQKTQAFDDWLEEQRQSAAIKRYWSLDKMPPDTDLSR
jgi:parvulin-like peptidyl-prolyl isomerase